MSKEKRYDKKLLTLLGQNKKYKFKFVVTTEDDIGEILSIGMDCDFLEKNIWLMPGADTREKLNELEPKVVEWCKEYDFNYSTRMHIQIYDQKTGV